MTGMTGKKEIFATAVASGSTLKAAAVTAGYSPRSAGSLGSKLAKRPEIAARIKELTVVETREALIRAGLTDRLKQSLGHVDFGGEMVVVLMPRITAQKVATVEG